MKVLITSPSLDARRNVNGISAVVMAILGRSRHRYAHYVLGRRDDQREGAGWVLGLLAQLLRFPFFARRERVQLLHQNLPFDTKGILRESVVMAWARLLRIPVLVHVHGGALLMTGCQNRWLRKVAHWMLSQAQVVVVLSEHERDAMHQHFGAKIAVEVLPNAVEVPPTSPEHRSRPGGLPTLLFIGRLHESKGLHDLVDALALIDQQHRPHFVVCGAGPLETWLVARCTALLGDGFSFLGVVAGDAKWRAYAESDIFVLPSRYGEGLPMALLEAMACGLVPVVTDDASMKVVVQDGVNGLRVAKHDPADIARQLQALCGDAALRRRLAGAARATAKTSYSLGPYLQRLDELYGRCVAGRGRP